jgi:tRNA pseudouridine55 synthase
MDFEKGAVLLINKPLRWTSFDVVKKIRGLIRVKKVGHAGTLDPLATGLLILCTGKMTKQIDNYQAQEKEYTGELILGVTTSSYDREQPVDGSYPIEHITESAIFTMAAKFQGELMQFPPAHSAVKIDGKRAYEIARKGKPTDIKGRLVHIKSFEITGIKMPYVSFRVVCGKGTYIRSLVHDFGKALESGACLESLCRTRIGEYRIENAKTPDQFNEEFQSGIQSPSD